MLSTINVLFLEEIARRLNEQQIAGDFVECDVYRGGSAVVLAERALHSPFQRILWLYDSFAGFSEASDLDDAHSHTLKGAYVGKERTVRRLLKRVRLPEEHLVIRSGWFSDTFCYTKPKAVALLHIDCDFYDSVKLSLGRLSSRCFNQRGLSC